ncbi:unnamed protein product [Candidula unifasciata]|uniref:Beta-1,4-galactosyltransferase n=1 Tax=Candidula unifasciata TaxID=100452 RepID=A0A8S4A805_9EUPU|nr:unnamed protein product [Candidula unifasciata]
MQRRLPKTEEKRTACWFCIAWPSSKLKRRNLFCFFIILISLAAVLLLLYPVLNFGIVSQLMTVKKQRQQKVCHFDFNNSSKGPIYADTETVPSIDDLEQDLSPSLLPGGHYIPLLCKSKYKVAIIVPFRDRDVHLKIFLRHMHPFLQRQNLEYGIIVVEQEADSLFNRAILFNIGFIESIKVHSYDCFVFHDVDLLPLDDRNYYSCGDQPVHLSAAIDTHNYKLMYHELFGGASMMTREMVEKVNGFSNVYFGWGGEDDDMSYRIRSHSMLIERYASDVARYTMMRHAKENKEDRTRLFATSRQRIHKDGLNSLKYELLDKELRPLYTWIYVRINQTEILRGQNLIF